MISEIFLGTPQAHPSPCPSSSLSEHVAHFMSSDCVTLFLSSVEKVNEPNRCWTFSYHQPLWWSHFSYWTMHSQSLLMCSNSYCGPFMDSISKLHSTSWNTAFIICTLMMSRWRSQNPKSFDQGHTGLRIIFLKTLIVLIVKYHLFWIFVSWIVCWLISWPSSELPAYLWESPTQYVRQGLATQVGIWEWPHVSSPCALAAGCRHMTQTQPMACCAWFSASTEAVHQHRDR